MTLALACLTREFVILVADRRVTLTVGNDVLDDFATKVVVVCDRGAIAYSGLATLPVDGLPVPDQPRMDDWIVQTLVDKKVRTLSEAAKVLSAAATDLFKGFHLCPGRRRHVFMLAGWTLAASTSPVPVVCVVSNALDDHWEWRATAEDSFTQRVFLQEDPRKFTLHSIGATFPQATVDELRRSLRRGFEKGIGPASVFRLSVRAIRSVAAINTTVSKHLLGVYVPRSAVKHGPYKVLAGGPYGDSIAFVDFKMPQEFGRWMGPHFVCGGAGVTGVEVGRL